ncbi:MAG: hypothetical protein EPO26_08290 [Chloroflexota bacterium]|nr:MAG: hypothetical protein EPO26_08290 [Chloroflexota bacterium]
MALDFIKRLFGGTQSKDPVDRGDYVYVKCSRCGEVLRARIDRIRDLTPDFEVGDDSPRGYSTTKAIVGKKCFRVIPVTVTYDRARREAARSVEGGEFVSAEEFAAATVA